MWKGEQLVVLTPKAFATLLTLVRQAGQVVEKDDLLRTVWRDTFVSEETLTQNIATIRRALGDSSEQPQYVATVPRRGYRFIAEVTPRSQHAALPLSPPLVAVDAGRDREHAVRPARDHVWIGVAALAAILSVGVGVAYFTRLRSPEAPVGDQWQIYPPPGTTLTSASVLSPDGRSIAFVTIDSEGTTGLWVQRLGTLSPRRLPGTDDAGGPFWSPDGRTIGFTAHDTLKRMSPEDPGPQALASVFAAQRRWGGAWSPTGVLLYPENQGGPLYQVYADDTRKPVTRLADGERVHLWPCFLPDGRHFLYRAAAFDESRSGTYIGSLDSMEREQVLDASSSAAVYAAPGYLLFVRDHALMAQRFDPERRRLAGAAAVIAPDVEPPDDAHGFTFSAAGDVISYVSGGSHSELTWFDRSGRSLGVLENSTDLKNQALSPDETQVIAGRPRADMGGEMWIANTTAGTPSRFDIGLHQGGLPVWSSDGEHVIFASAGDIYRTSAHGGQAELLIRANPDQMLKAQDLSRDDRFLVYLITGPHGSRDVWRYSLADHHAEPLLQSRAAEIQAQLSPDGHWIGYASNETDRWEVYVQSFPTLGSKQKVSVSGGAQPQWSRNGKELFYLSLDNTLMAVDVGPGPPLRLSAPRALFHVALKDSLESQRNHYVVSRDGQRFLVSALRLTPPAITVRFGWTTMLRP